MIKFVCTVVIVTGLVFVYLLITIIGAVGRHVREKEAVTQCVIERCE